MTGKGTGKAADVGKNIRDLLGIGGITDPDTLKAVEDYARSGAGFIGEDAGTDTGDFLEDTGIED